MWYQGWYHGLHPPMRHQIAGDCAPFSSGTVKSIVSKARSHLYGGICSDSINCTSPAGHRGDVPMVVLFIACAGASAALPLSGMEQQRRLYKRQPRDLSKRGVRGEVVDAKRNSISVRRMGSVAQAA